MENIQLYLHAKFHIFLRSLSISFPFILTYLKKQTEKGIEIGKGVSDPFSSTGLLLQRPGPIPRVSQPITISRATVTASWAPLMRTSLLWIQTTILH
jgi:hypothetical protein